MQAASDWTSRHGRKGPFGLRVPIKYAPPQVTVCTKLLRGCR